VIKHQIAIHLIVFIQTSFQFLGWIWRIY